MGLGARGARAALLLGALQVLALLGTPERGAADPHGSPGSQNSTHLQIAGSTGAVRMPSNHTGDTSNVTMTPPAPASSVSSRVAGSPAPSQVTTPRVSTNMTPLAPKPTSKTGVSWSTPQVSASTVTMAHNSSVTSVSSSMTITATVNSKENKGSKFDIGSFVGGIVLTLGVLSMLYIGCKTYYSRRGIRYRTIDEHDAII